MPEEDAHSLQLVSDRTLKSAFAGAVAEKGSFMSEIKQRQTQPQKSVRGCCTLTHSSRMEKIQPNFDRHSG